MKWKVSAILFQMALCSVGAAQALEDLQPSSPTPAIEPISTVTMAICVKPPSNAYKKIKLNVLYDGIPVSTKKRQIRKYITDIIDTAKIDTVLVAQGEYACKKPREVTLVVLSSDSLNAGLKHILAKTNNWMIENPTATVFMNNRKIKWNARTMAWLAKIDPASIQNIKLVDPKKTDNHCKNGKMKLKVTRDI